MSSWSAAVIRLRAIGVNKDDLVWVPSADRADRSMMIADEANAKGEFVVFLLSGGGSGATTIGSLVLAPSAAGVNVEVLEVDLAPIVESGSELKAGVSFVTSLSDPTPNPFNPRTKIAFELARSELVSISVYDVAGRLISRLIENDLRTAGHHVVEWDGRDKAGLSMAAGVYFCVLDSPTVRLTKRMTMLK
ncbi:MAG: T9SS type A sorting domain-containing protein [bacterium]|nr:T9SS type A sorting domain-containing protein [bacterium]